MRGEKPSQVTMLSLQQPGDLVPKDHPLRAVKGLADAALWELNSTFDKMYSKKGRASVPPERLLKATLLMAFYTIRSERLFCEQLAYNMLFRWFLDMDNSEQPFDHSTFSQNRERLLKHDVARKFFTEIIAQARERGLMSDDHFTVDGTLIEAWASLKSFRKKDEPKSDDDSKGGGPWKPSNPDVDFKNEKRSNETHQSTTDPESKLARKGNGKEAKLSFCGNALMENRNGLIADFLILPATGLAEREAALQMLDRTVPGTKRITLGADKGYDVAGFIDSLRERNVTPHVAAKDTSRLDQRTLRHGGYYVSQLIRKRVEEIFGWLKTVGNFRRTRYRGVAKTQQTAYMLGAAFNLIRIANLSPA
jgi:transposase